mmetsp:Transcript_56210/g.131333  ORF Transcript_56210/g.131333 Transcript_56210/m.131333 type:complete len:96 (+) Transcript_56210:514-801(+)
MRARTCLDGFATANLGLSRISLVKRSVDTDGRSPPCRTIVSWHQDHTALARDVQLERRRPLADQLPDVKLMSLRSMSWSIVLCERVDLHSYGECN